VAVFDRALIPLISSGHFRGQPVSRSFFNNNCVIKSWNRKKGRHQCVRVPVAAAISIFGFESGAALATVVGVLIEVPVMLAVVRVMNGTQTRYEARAA
jgi:hypothetical protein